MTDRAACPSREGDCRGELGDIRTAVRAAAGAIAGSAARTGIRDGRGQDGVNQRG